MKQVNLTIEQIELLSYTIYEEINSISDYIDDGTFDDDDNELSQAREKLSQLRAIVIKLSEV